MEKVFWFFSFSERKIWHFSFFAEHDNDVLWCYNKTLSKNNSLLYSIFGILSKKKFCWIVQMKNTDVIMPHLADYIFFSFFFHLAILQVNLAFRWNRDPNLWPRIDFESCTFAIRQSVFPCLDFLMTFESVNSRNHEYKLSLLLLLSLLFAVLAKTANNNEGRLYLCLTVVSLFMENGLRIPVKRIKAKEDEFVLRKEWKFNLNFFPRKKA